MNQHETIEDHWLYNCEDCTRTLEIADEELKIISKMGLQGPHDMQQSMFYPVLHAMCLGVRIDLDERAKMAHTLDVELKHRESYFRDVLGHDLNPRSPKQMMRLFYEDLKQKPIISRKTGKPTLDDDALEQVVNREPILRPLVKSIQEYRSLGVFLSTFVEAELDEDQRMRCAYNICGAETYRLSSRENAFGSGTNLQNIPKGHKAKEPEDLELPNIRKLFIPDEGYTFFDMDLDRADLQVVVWEADDAELKLALRNGIDMHLMNACAIDNLKGIPYEELTETHPNYKEHRQKIGEDRRQNAKKGVHAVNYFCKAATLAKALGCSTHQADKFITGWLDAHPGIRKWHKRTEDSLRRTRSVSNAYGYKRTYFDRIEGLLPEALGWIPQSTVAITINKIWLRVYEGFRGNIDVLLQVHDSLAGQFPTDRSTTCLAALKACSNVTIPYSDPLIIPTGIKTSTRSWGDVK